ncbi:MAG: D-2-hydroxyacid dehydrogenase [Rheinheimera sp.]
MSQLVFLDQATLPDIDVSALQQCALPLQCYPHTAPTEVLTRLADATVAIVNKVQLNAEILAQLPKLQLICVTATGTNNIDLAAARSAGIVVCNARDYATLAVPQHAMALLLGLFNQTAWYQQAVQQGAWTNSPQFCWLGYPIRQLAGLNFTVVGYGGLGQATARLAAAFGMQIVIAERPGALEIRAGRLSFRQALAQADVLSLHCPATHDNYHLLNSETLSWLKPSAVVLNTARGSLIDAVALASALKTGKLAGAALDVLETEPPSADHPLLQPDVPHLLISPHVGWASQQAMQQLVTQTAENIQSFFAGAPIRCC